MFNNPDFRTRVIPSFYHRATEMRRKYEQFFANPSQATRGEHFKCNVWYVPKCYSYNRIHADDVLGIELYDDFQNYLRMFARQLGFHNVTGSLLSFYRSGDFQSTHSDMKNGSLAYVYSLTDWANRKFTGGETLVARPDIFDKLEPREHRSYQSYWEEYAAHFGQLLLFDDRLAHMVPTIQGTMDPLDARVVIHGHIY